MVHNSVVERLVKYTQVMLGYEMVTSLLRLTNGASNKAKLLIVILNLLYPPQTRAHCHTKSPVNSSRV